MREAAIRIHEELEELHWWFAGRRRIILTLLRRLVQTGDGYLLDVGCGTGGNLKYLAASGYKIVGLEPEPRMADIARRKSGCKVYEGELLGGLERLREDVRVVLLLDVLEHIEDDLAALRAVHRRLPQGGCVVVTVPACPWLWSYHDESFGHYRRYTGGELRERLTASGFQIVWLSHFNSLLFPLAASVRMLKKAFAVGEPHTDFRMPPSLLNSFLANLLASERLLVGRMRSPLGLSLQAVARKS